MTESLRIALVLDPFSIHLKERLQLVVKWGNHAPQLARELLGAGHVVRGFGAPPGLVPRSGVGLEHPEPRGAESGGGESDSGLSRESSKGALQTLKAFHPEVLVAYDALSPAAVRAARAARALDAGLVLVEAGPPGGGTLRERALARLGELAWGRMVRRTAQAVVALDEVARGRALEEGFDERLITIIPHGIDVGRFRPGLTSTLVARRRVRGRILLFVGRLAPDRGLDVLLNAFSRTVAQRGDWTLVVAGEGPELPRLRAQAQRLGIAANVHWLGRPRDEELPGLIGAATLVASPALSDVSNGRQVMRAMACGVAVIASDLPRYRGLLQSEVSGLLVPAGDQGAWEEALRRASGSPISRQRWAQEARRVAVQQFSWESVAARFEGILTQARARALQQAAERASQRRFLRRPA